MMKVLWFSLSPCSAAERGAEGRSVSGGWLVSLEKELRKEPDIQLEIAYLSSGNEAEDEFVHEGVKYYAIRPFRSESYWKFRIARRFMSEKRQEENIYRRMCTILDRSRPDIIHIHGTERPFGRIAACAGDIPVVYSIQGLMSACAEKFYSGISRETARRYEGLMCRLRKKSADRDYKVFLYHAANERRFLSGAKNVIGRTAWDRRMTGLFNPDRRYFHVDEIMRGPFYRAQWSKSSFGVPLSLVSVFSYGLYKGFETLLKTAKVLKDNAELEFVWTVIGYAGNENYVRIAEKATGLHSGDVGIRFVGRKSAEEMVEIMSGADMFCHFSHIENSPNAVCEAMLLGMPVVATDVGGTSGILEDGTEGVLVQDGEPYAFAAAVSELYNDFSKAASLGAAARKKAVARHDPQKICAEIKSVYDVLTSR